MTGAKQLVRIPDAVAALSMVGLVLLYGWAGLGAGAAVLAGYAAAIWVSARTLGGFSGDLAGYALTVSELCGLLALAIL